jgi:hypothetical protein
MVASPTVQVIGLLYLTVCDRREPSLAVSRGADVVQRGDLTPSRGRGASGYSDIAGVAGRRPTVLVKAVLKSLAEA